MAESQLNRGLVGLALRVARGDVPSPTAVDVIAVIARHAGHAALRSIDAREDAKISSAGGVQFGEITLQLVTDALGVGRQAALDELNGGRRHLFRQLG